MCCALAKFGNEDFVEPRESSGFCVEKNFMEKGVLELGTKGWVGVYLSEREKAFQAEGIASAKVQRHVMCGRRV